MNLATTPPYLVGADAGTSGCKVTLIDSAGHVLAESHAGYDTDYPKVASVAMRHEQPVKYWPCIAGGCALTADPTTRAEAVAQRSVPGDALVGRALVELDA